MDYIEELEKIIRNKELSNEQWKELVCDLIQIIPENKYTLLYEKIFEITERNYEELHSLLPKYYDIEEILESKVEEHYYNYLEAIFYSKDINTMEKLAIK